MPDKERFFVVIGINEPAGNGVWVVRPDLAGIGIENIHAADPDLDPSPVRRQDLHVRLPEDHEQVGLVGLPELVRHVEVGVHPGLGYRDAAEPAGFGDVASKLNAHAICKIQSSSAELRSGGLDGYSELVILHRATPTLVYRIAHRILRKLPTHCILDINLQIVGEVVH